MCKPRLGDFLHSFFMNSICGVKKTKGILTRSQTDASLGQHCSRVKVFSLQNEFPQAELTVLTREVSGWLGSV